MIRPVTTLWLLVELSAALLAVDVTAHYLIQAIIFPVFLIGVPDTALGAGVIAVM